MKLGRIGIGFAIGLAIIGLGSPAGGQDIDPTPYALISGALNVVSTTGDGDGIRTFYGELLGLPEIAPIAMPDGSTMLRFMAGATELKFIVIDRGLPKTAGGFRGARGIRRLTIFVNDGEKVIERLEAAGHDTSGFYDGEGALQLSGELRDPDDNALALVFLPDELDAREYKRMRIELTVGNMGAARRFFGQTLGLREEAPTSSGGDDMKYLFQAGATAIRLMHADPALPSEVVYHTDRIGMHYIQFIVRDVEAVYEKMQEKEATIAREPFDLGELARIFFVASPDGTIVEFVGAQRR